MKNFNRSDKLVAILVGGASTEREVSRMSARGVLEAVKNLGYKYRLIDPALGINQPANEIDFFEADFSEIIHKRNYLEAVNSNLFDNVDTVFNALHGSWGEDGTVQSLLEFRGLTYTGSGVLPCSISMNKTFTKVMFQHYGVNTPKWILVNYNGIDYKALSEKIDKELNLPCVVKPNNQGSAIGLTICKSYEVLEEAVKLAAQFTDEVLIEEYIEGYELTVGLLNGHVFPPLQIKPKHDFYDYTCKYTSGMSIYEVPANFPVSVLDKLKEQALLAYNSVSCKSYGRIDFRLNMDLEPFCLEVNTLPGLTSTSLLPKTAKAEGIMYEELVDRIISDSLNSKI